MNHQYLLGPSYCYGIKKNITPKLIIEYIAFFIGGKLYVFHNTSITNIAGVTTPVWAKCEDETHTPKKWELGVLLDSQKFRA